MHVSIPYGDSINQELMICEEASLYGHDSIECTGEDLMNQLDCLLFSLQIDGVVDGSYPKRDMVTVLNYTPKLLNDIGLPNLPIVITQKHIYTIINNDGKYKNVNYHGLGIDIIKQIPGCIKKPLYVLKSRTRDDSILIITKLRDNYSRPVVASIRINGKGQIKNIQFKSNVMTSVYGRNNYNKFLMDNVMLGNLLYDHNIGIIKKLDTTNRKQ